MDDYAARKQAVLDKIKQLRAEKSEAVSFRQALEKEMQDIADGIPESALKGLPKNVTDGLTKYRGKKK
jgi:chaperonin cofactor prefoldin